MDPEEAANYGPLAELGLVDPKTGQAVATSDWQPPQQPQQTNDYQPPRRQEDGQQPQGDQPAQGQQQQQQRHPDVERLERENAELRSRIGPADPAQQAATTFQQRQQELQQYANQAYSLLISTPSMEGPNGQRIPMPPALAQQIVGAQLESAIAKAQVEADRAALLPTAKRQVAESIAKEVGGSVTADDLVSLGSVDAMRAKAETLRDARRDTSFQQRRSGNTDRTEGGASTGVSVSQAIDSLNPTEIIKLGVLRGQA